MAKIVRKTSKLFASTAGGSDIGVFGSLAAGSPAYSTDPAVIQSLSNFLTGWAAETIATRRPAYQDFNALDFLTFYQLGYLFQAGVAEWDAGTNYFIGSICAGVGTGILYRSLVDDNLNHAVSDGTKWEAVVKPLVINTLTEKTAPVGADLMLIEDSAAGNAQKKVQLVNATGMMKVQTGTVSAQSSFTISGLTPGVKYKLVLNLLQNTTAGNKLLRFNADSGANYNFASTANSYDGQTYIQLGALTSAGKIDMVDMTFMGNADDPTKEHLHATALHRYNNGASMNNWVVAGLYEGAAAITSLILSTDAGTMTGTWSLYQLS